MRSYQLNNHIRIILQNEERVDASAIYAYESFFNQLLSAQATCQCKAVEIAHLPKHKMVIQPLKVYPYLEKKLLPPFVFIVFKN
jgi:hypothetical protein